VTLTTKIVLGAIVLLLLAIVASYNRFVRQRNLVEESWRQVDVELRRRYDLVPNLVATVKAYAAHERQVFESVVAARAQAQAPEASRAAQGDDESVLTRSLRGLLAVAEAYPALKADQQFRDLQAQLAETEDRIASTRSRRRSSRTSPASARPSTSRSTRPRSAAPSTCGSRRASDLDLELVHLVGRVAGALVDALYGLRRRRGRQAEHVPAGRVEPSALEVHALLALDLQVRVVRGLELGRSDAHEPAVHVHELRHRRLPSPSGRRRR
jgi:LemA protein